MNAYTNTSVDALNTLNVLYNAISDTPSNASDKLNTQLSTPSDDTALTNITQTYSQLNQDRIVCEFYNYKRGGYFIDIGANDGITLSNTYLLEQQYGWTGVCVEPMPAVYDKLIQVRTAICDNHALFNKSGESVEFLVSSIMGGMLSGISEYISDNYLYNAIRHSESHPINVQTLTLTDLLDKYNAPTFIEYASIDTEGTEIEILRGFNFDKYTIGYISIEHNYINSTREKIHDILISNGYLYKSDNSWDDDYIHKSQIEGSYIRNNKKYVISILPSQRIIRYARAVYVQLIKYTKEKITNTQTLCMDIKKMIILNTHAFIHNQLIINGKIYIKQ